MKFVSILIASKSDYDTVKHCLDTFDKFNVKYELVITSAHKSLDRTKQYINDSQEKGALVYICADTLSTHTAAVVSSLVTKPVLALSIKENSLDKSAIAMPEGMPVGLVATGKTGAINSAYLAMQILALSDADLAVKLKEDRIIQSKKVENESALLEVIL